MLNYDQNGGRHRICVQKYIGHQRTLLNSKVEYRTSSGAQANAKGLGTASSSSMKTVNSDGSISTPDSESEDDEGEDVQELELTVGRHEPVYMQAGDMVTDHYKFIIRLLNLQMMIQVQPM